jgi:glycosyltransferase involved in cell wall biosynthesis
MEFLSLGIPVVVSSTKIDRFYFNDSVVRFFESGNEKALTQAMLEVIRNQKLRESLAQAASGYVAVNSWEQKTPEYLSLVDSLTTTE